MITQQLSLFIVTAILLAGFLMLMQSRIINLVKLLIAQNVLLVMYLLLKAFSLNATELFISGGITFFIKVLILPWLLFKLVRYFKLANKTDPFLNKTMLLFAGIILTVFAFILSHRIEHLIGQHAIIAFSLSLANAFIAILVIISRRKAITQVIGLLVLENSIFLLSITLTTGFPLIVELGIVFDLLIGFMIFALFLLRIRTTHGSLKIQHLEELKETI